MGIVYLGYNGSQRGFDDPSQIRIQMEALACQVLFDWAEQGRTALVWSFMHLDETVLCPRPNERSRFWNLVPSVMCTSGRRNPFGIRQRCCLLEEAARLRMHCTWPAPYSATPMCS